jgi:protein-tyrosine phosphatase
VTAGSILVVCTGNICRSPMAEGILRTLLRGRGVGGVDVSSAGVAGWDGSGATPEAVQAMAQNGIDISEHVARRLDPAMVKRAGLVLGMAEEHSEAAVFMDPTASDRTFTLKELVKLLDHSPEAAADTMSNEDAPRRLRGAMERAASARAAGRVQLPADQDVADPLGLGVQAFLATAWELGELCRQLVDQVFGEAVEEAGAPARAEGGRPE